MEGTIFSPTLADAFAQAGVPYPGETEPGRIRRFSTNGKPHDTAGWLRVFDDGDGAAFGSWRDDVSFVWQRKKDGPPPSLADIEALKGKAAQARQHAEAEREAGYVEAAHKATQAWQAAVQTGQHPYLANKRIRAHGTRINGDALMIPVFNDEGHIQSLQTILPDGTKRFMSGGKMAGGRYWLGEPSEAGPLLVCEGFATAAALNEATGYAVACAFNAGNLHTVATDTRQRYPAAKLVIAGDDDRATEGNPGRTKATAVAHAVNGTAVFPELGPQGSDFHDMAMQKGLESVNKAIQTAVSLPPRFNLAESTAARLFIGSPPPQQWLVEGIYPEGKVSVLASPPGIGKSFLALDLCRAVSAPRALNASFCFGAMVKAHGRAVYVSAEDDLPELHRRLYSLSAGAMSDKLHVVSLPDVGHFGIIQQDRLTRGFIVTAEWRALSDEIRALHDVKLVVLDTLQALTTGDTNTAEAVQPLMNEASALAAATGAAVLLIHHVGKGSTKEIKTALDAAEAVRGSGAIVGSARAVYVLWPPGDGGKSVCEQLGEAYEEGAVALGMVAKANGAARRDRTVYHRDKRGLLVDVTMRYAALAGANDDAMRAELVQLIAEANEAGEPYSAAVASHKALHARRHNLPAAYQEKSRAWFSSQVDRMLESGDITKESCSGGFVLTVADAGNREAA